ncbi:MAG: type II secretion system protein GspL [Pseudomonadota bacterium]
MSKDRGIPAAPLFWNLGEGAPPGGAHVALVPGASAPVLPIELPPTLSGAAREQVAERQLIEQLSLAPATFEMHPLQPKSAKSWSHVVVLDSERAKQWRGATTRATTALLPDYMALPTADGLWAIVVDADTVSVRIGADEGLSGERDLVEAQLSRAAPPDVILRLGDADQELDDFLLGFDADIVTDPAELKKAGITVVRWADSVGGLNLLAPPSASVDRLRAGLKRWRMAAVAAAVAAIAWMGSTWAEMQAAETRAALAEQRIEGLVREHFVPSGPILDVRAQVTAAVEAALVPDVIELQTIPAMVQFQIAAEILTRDGANVLSVFFRPETGLETIVATDDFSVLDDLIIGLQDADFLVEQLESRAQQTGGVVAQLRLELFE